MRPRRITIVAALAAVALAAASAGPASADRGVALDLGKIEVSETLVQGGEYHLPPLHVRNPGDEPSGYAMRINYIETEGRRAADPAWFSFSPAGFTLEPQQSQEVAVTLNIPGDADPGDYLALVQAEIVLDGEGARLGGAAASKLTFTVEASTLLGEWQARVEDFLAATSPWWYVVPSLIAALGLLRLVTARFSFRLERRK